MNAPVPRAALETVAERIRYLQAEARSLAGEHVGDLCVALDRVEKLAGEIATGGDAYPPGVRDIAQRLVEDMVAKAQNIRALMERQP